MADACRLLIPVEGFSRVVSIGCGSLLRLEAFTATFSLQLLVRFADKCRVRPLEPVMRPRETTQLLVNTWRLLVTHPPNAVYEASRVGRRPGITCPERISRSTARLLRPLQLCARACDRYAMRLDASNPVPSSYLVSITPKAGRPPNATRKP